MRQNRGIPIHQLLVILGSITANLLGAVEAASGVCSGTWLGDKLQKISASTNSVIQFPRLQI